MLPDFACKNRSQGKVSTFQGFRVSKSGTTEAAEECCQILPARTAVKGRFQRFKVSEFQSLGLRKLLRNAARFCLQEPQSREGFNVSRFQSFKVWDYGSC